MDPGPIDGFLLMLQDRHRSEAIWNETIDLNACLYVRRVEGSLRRRVADQPLDPRVIQLLESSGFLGVSRISFIQIDWHLITALVERWRQETHTFYMACGEMTITLQDMAIQFGLSIDGATISGSTKLQWGAQCAELLGLRPPTNSINGGRVKLSWLSNNFSDLPENSNDTVVLRYTRAYILQLIGGLLFSDKSQNRVHLMFLPLLEDLQPERPYSWGSAVLAWLYRQLCNATDKEVSDISGAVLLVQLWAWERLPFIAPFRRQPGLVDGGPLAAHWGVLKDVTRSSTHVVTAYRIDLDKHNPSQTIWEPYTPDIIAALPAYCTRDAHLWTARVPLICFHIVEWHFLNRVVRQFGGCQGIPRRCKTKDDLHGIDLWNKTDAGWRARHNRFLRKWTSRLNSVVQVVPGGCDISADYMEWYLVRTRRWISRTGAQLCYLVEQMQTIRSHVCGTSEPYFQFIEETTTTTLHSAGVFDDDDSDSHHDEDANFETSLLMTPAQESDHDDTTPQAPEKRHSRRRFPRDEGPSIEQPEFGSASAGDYVSQITQIDSAELIQPADEEERPAITRYYLRTRRHK